MEDNEFPPFLFRCWESYRDPDEDPRLLFDPRVGSGQLICG